MMPLVLLKFFLIHVLSVYMLVRCQPVVKHLAATVHNNSYINLNIISTEKGALRCLCSIQNYSFVGDWKDKSGRPAHQGLKGANCLYVTGENGRIYLNRKTECIQPATGLWRCTMPECGEESTYVYIGNSTAAGRFSSSNKIAIIFTCDTSIHAGLLHSNEPANFTLHTEPNAGVPEFTISCITNGGPASTVEWHRGDLNIKLDKNDDYQTSQIILNTETSTYDNRLRFSGRESVMYTCIISNAREKSSVEKSLTIEGITLKIN